MTSLPLRYQFAAVLVGLNVIGTGVLASFAYRTSRQSLEDQAWLAVGSVAEARQLALVRLVQRRQERMRAFLGSVQSLCGERSASGRLGWEPECVRAALLGFGNAEQATATELRYGTRRLARGGSSRRAIEPPPEGQLASVTADAGRREYTMRAVRGRLVLNARFPLDDLEAIFQDRSGLRSNGEVFFTNAQGSFLTPVRYPQPPTQNPPALAEPLRRCLAGASGEMLSRDYRGAAVISGFRPTPAIAGGCVVANLQYSDALVPIRRLGRTFLYGSTGFVLVSIALSLLIARAAAKPILQREHAARLEAENANRLKDDFLATLSHELRTPLNAILGWSSIIGHGRADPTRTANAIRAIERSARTQARLVDELLDVSRIISGRMRLNITGVSLNSIVEAALEAVRPAAEAKGLEIVKHLDPSTRTIAGDPHRLQQVVWNLLSNAVRFTLAGGRVDVTLCETSAGAEIQVSDTGIGIHPDFVPHVFERFRQADSGVTRVHGGLGLGLAIVRHLVELHGGTVGAESAGEGRGATFTVRLPLRAEVPALIAEVAALRQTPVTLPGTRVLVVDDDPDARDVLRAMLEDAGATVATTASAGETRAVIGSVQPDLLIADIGMPGEDGYSLIRSIRALESGRRAGHVPAIALTAHARAEDVERALASGFQVHIAKPVESSQLLSTIATLVQTRN